MAKAGSRGKAMGFQPKKFGYSKGKSLEDLKPLFFFKNVLLWKWHPLEIGLLDMENHDVHHCLSIGNHLDIRDIEGNTPHKKETHEVYHCILGSEYT